MPPESPKHTFHWKNQTSDLAKNASLLKSHALTHTLAHAYRHTIQTVGPKGLETLEKFV